MAIGLCDITTNMYSHSRLAHILILLFTFTAVLILTVSLMWTRLALIYIFFSALAESFSVQAHVLPLHVPFVGWSLSQLKHIPIVLTMLSWHVAWWTITWTPFPAKLMATRQEMDFSLSSLTVTFTGKTQIELLLPFKSKNLYYL